MTNCDRYLMVSFARLARKLIMLLSCFAISGMNAGSAELQVSEPVTCKAVRGWRDYVRLEPAELTTFDKLIIYVEPTGFATKKVEGKLQACLVQNGKVRAKGAKKVIFEREELLRFEPVVMSTSDRLYLAATVGFKNLVPGDYVLELETVDMAVESKAKVLQQIDFRIVEPDEQKPAVKVGRSRNQPK